MPGPFAKFKQAQQNWRANAQPFPHRLEGLLGGGNTLFDVGIGLLSASGPSPYPPNTGNAIAQAMQFAQGRQAQALENQARRDAITEQQRRRQAQQQLPGLLGDPNATQEQLMGLLGQANPEGLVDQAMNSLFSSPQEERAEPAEVRVARVLADPNESEEVKQEIRAQMAQSGNQELAAQIQLQLNMMQLEKARQEAADAAENRRIAWQTSETAANRTLHNFERAAELNEFLSTTALRSGATFSDLKRKASEGLAEIGEFFGVDTSEARRINAALDEFNKLTNELIISEMGRISAGGSAPNTNQMLSTLSSSMAGVGIAPEANAQIFAKGMRDIIDMADIEGFEIDDPQRYLDLSERLLSLEPYTKEPTVDLPAAASAAGNAVNSAASQGADMIRNIGQMTIEQLNQIDLGQLSDDALKAAADRWDQLNAR